MHNENNNNYNLRDKFVKSFGKKLKKILQEKNLKNKDLSIKTGIPIETISKYLNGERIPQMDSFLSICFALNINANYFLNSDANYFTTDAEKVILGLNVLYKYNLLIFENDVARFPLDDDDDIIKEILEEISLHRFSRISNGSNFEEQLVRAFKDDIENLLKEHNENFDKYFIKYYGDKYEKI